MYVTLRGIGITHHELERRVSFQGSQHYADNFAFAVLRQLIGEPQSG